MSFVADIIEDVVDAVVDVVETVVDLVVDVVEAVVDAAASLLGFNAEDQVIEYFEVHNQPLFSSSIVDNGLTSQMMASALYNDINVNDAITYNAIFGDSIPKSLKRFIKYIEDGNYYTGFPEVQSFLNYVDESEVTNILNSIHGTPVTIDNSHLGRLTIPDWIEWWLYNNKSYSLDTRMIGNLRIAFDRPIHNVSTNDYTIYTYEDTVVTTNVSTTAPTTTSSDSYVSPDQTLSDEVGTSDSVDITVDQTVESTLPYNVPTKPTGAHIVVEYHLDSAPSNRLLFKYKLGSGTYPDLDNSETDLNISSSDLKTLPAVPIRLNNTNFTGGTHETQIKELLATVKLDAEGILEGIVQDYTGSMSDLDHIYVNFGVRMRDTTQGGLRYLYNIFERLHASNSVTEADYTSATGEKPYNNIIVTQDEYKYIFKYAYTTFTHNTLAEVIADTDLSNIYYSKSHYFNGNNTLAKPYYASTAQALYKVQYKADNISEVNAYLAGNGVLAPGTTSTEGQDKLQVTTRIAYSDTIYAANGTDSGHDYLKPDLTYERTGGDIYSDTRTHCVDHYVYVRYNGAGKVEIAGAEPSGAVHTGRGDCGGTAQGWYTAVDQNISGYTDVRIEVTASSTNGGGGTYDTTIGVTDTLGNTIVGSPYSADGAQQPSIQVVVTFSPSPSSTLKVVNTLSEESTQSQEITYYEIVANGLNSYKVKAPIGALNVIDGETGKFKLVKFNLANPDDLMIPLFYGAIPQISSKDLSSIWLSSAHASMYIARYEVIEANGNFFKILIMIVIIVVIAVYTGYIDPSTWGTVTQTTVTSGTAANGTVLVTNSFGVVTSQTLVNGVVTSSQLVWSATALNMASTFITNQLISFAIQKVAEDVSPELAMVLGAALQFTYGFGSTVDFSRALSIEDMIRITTIAVDTYSGIETYKLNEEMEYEEVLRQTFTTKLQTAYGALEDAYADIEEFLDLGGTLVPGLNSEKRGYINPAPAENFYARALGSAEMIPQTYNFADIMNQQYNFDMQYRQV